MKRTFLIKILIIYSLVVNIKYIQPQINEDGEENFSKRDHFYNQFYKAMIEENKEDQINVILENKSKAFEYIDSLYSNCISPNFTGEFLWEKYEGITFNGIQDRADLLYVISLMTEAYKAILEPYQIKEVIVVDSLLSEVHRQFIYCDRVDNNAQYNHLKYAIELNPKNIAALLELGRVYSILDSNIKCIQISKQALALNPDNNMKGTLFNNIGLSYIKRGENKTAIDNLKKAIQYIDYPMVFYNLFVAYYNDGQFSLAKKYIDQSVKKGLYKHFDKNTIQEYLDFLEQILPPEYKEEE